MTAEFNIDSHESIICIRDNDDREYAFYLNKINGTTKTKEELTEDEKAKCLDVRGIVVTEHWQTLETITWTDQNLIHKK